MPVHMLVYRILFDTGFYLYRLLYYHTLHHADVTVVVVTTPKQIRERKLEYYSQFANWRIVKSGH